MVREEAEGVGVKERVEQRNAVALLRNKVVSKEGRKEGRKRSTKLNSR